MSYASQRRADGIKGSGGMDFQFRQRVAEHYATSASLKSTFQKILIIQCLLLISSLFLVKIILTRNLIMLLLVSAVGNLLSILIGFCGRSKTSSNLMRLNSAVIVTLCMFPLVLYLFLVYTNKDQLNTHGLIITHSILILIADLFAAVYSRNMVLCWSKGNEYKYKQQNWDMIIFGRHLYTDIYSTLVRMWNKSVLQNQVYIAVGLKPSSMYMILWRFSISISSLFYYLNSFTSR